MHHYTIRVPATMIVALKSHGPLSRTQAGQGVETVLDHLEGRGPLSTPFGTVEIQTDRDAGWTCDKVLEE